MKFKSTFIIGIVFLALCGYVVFYEILGEEGRKEAEEKKDRIYQVDLDDIVYINLERKGLSLEIERTDDGWHILRPVDYRGDNVYIEGLLKTFIRAKNEGRIAEENIQPADYGLGEDAVTIKIGLSAEDEYSLNVGIKNPTGRFAYANIPGSPEVFLTEANLYEKLHQEFYYYRDKTIFSYDREMVKQINVIRGDEKYIAVSDNESGWRVTYPVEDTADKNTVDIILNKFLSQKISNFTDDSPEDLEQYGLRNPRFRTELVFDGEEENKKIFYVGGRKGNIYYVRDSEKSIIYEVDSSAVHNVIPDLFTLRNKVINDFNKDAVNKLEVTYPGEKYIFIHDDTLQAWYQTYPIYKRAVNDKIDQMVNDIYWARAVGFVDEIKRDKKQYGLDPPAADVILRIHDEEVSHVQVGRQDGSDRYYFDVNQNRLYKVRSYIYARLVVPHDKLVW